MKYFPKKKLENFELLIKLKILRKFQESGNILEIDFTYAYEVSDKSNFK